MGPEGLDCTRIFFKDKKNELRGPYSEREVQEWYRKGWFDSSFPFYFLEEGSSPDDSSSSFTLDELCTRNGIGAPFCRPSDSPSPEKIRAQSELKLDCLEEEIRSLRVKCDGVLRVKERFGKMEEKIKSLPAQPRQLTNSVANAEAPVSPEEKDKKKTPKTVKKLVEQRDKKREAELSELNKWTDFFSDFYMAVLDGLQANDFRKAFQDYRDASFDKAKLITEHDEARSNFREKLIKKMKKRECIECSLCEFLAYNYKQWFIHSIDPRHIHNESLCLILSPGKFLVPICRNLTHDIGLKFKAEQEFFSKELAAKYASVSLDESRMLPNIAFADYLNKHYKRKVAEVCERTRADGSGDAIAERTSILGKAMCGSFMSVFFKELGLAAELMAELDAHIGTGLTYCLDCKVVTGTREEYYRHLLTYSHLTRPLRDLTFYPSIAVSVMRTDLAD